MSAGSLQILHFTERREEDDQICQELPKIYTELTSLCLPADVVQNDISFIVYDVIFFLFFDARLGGLTWKKVPAQPDWQNTGKNPLNYFFCSHFANNLKNMFREHHLHNVNNRWTLISVSLDILDVFAAYVMKRNARVSSYKVYRKRLFD